ETCKLSRQFGQGGRPPCRGARVLQRLSPRVRMDAAFAEMYFTAAVCFSMVGVPFLSGYHRAAMFGTIVVGLPVSVQILRVRLEVLSSETEHQEISFVRASGDFFPRFRSMALPKDVAPAFSYRDR